jgi:hypothetical protein
VRWGNLKLVYEDVTRYGRLYDLARDPLERNDLSAQMPLQLRALTQALRVAQARNAGVLLAAGSASSEELDPEMIRRLRALGYLR